VFRHSEHPYHPSAAPESRDCGTKAGGFLPIQTFRASTLQPFNESRQRNPFYDVTFARRNRAGDGTSLTAGYEG
jgi:hypothetical protein